MLPTRSGVSASIGDASHELPWGRSGSRVVYQASTSSGRSISCWRVPASGLSSRNEME